MAYNVTYDLGPKPIILNEPENKNFLSPINFKLEILKCPTVNWFCQTANLPGISTGKPEIPNPFMDLSATGDKIVKSSLTIGFLVDEDLKNWLEIWTWIKGLIYPHVPEEYSELQKLFPGKTARRQYYETGLFSEGLLHILNNNKNPNIYVKFNNLFPISISDLQFSTAETSETPLVATAEFAYTDYDITVSKTG